MKASTTDGTEKLREETKREQEQLEAVLDEQREQREADRSGAATRHARERDDMRQAVRQSRQALLISRCESRSAARSLTAQHAAAIKASSVSMQVQKTEKVLRIKRAHADLVQRKQRNQEEIVERAGAEYRNRLQHRQEQQREAEAATEDLMRSAQELWEELRTIEPPDEVGSERRTVWLRGLSQVVPISPENAPSTVEVLHGAAWHVAKRRAKRACVRTRRGACKEAKRSIKTALKEEKKYRAQRPRTVLTALPATDLPPDVPLAASCPVASSVVD